MKTRVLSSEEILEKLDLRARTYVENHKHKPMEQWPCFFCKEAPGFAYTVFPLEMKQRGVSCNNCVRRALRRLAAEGK